MKKIRILITAFVFSALSVLGIGIFSPLPQSTSQPRAEAVQGFEEPVSSEEKVVKQSVTQQTVSQKLETQNIESTPQDQTPENVTSKTPTNQTPINEEVHLTKEAPQPQTSNQKTDTQTQPISKARVEIEGLGSYSVTLEGNETAFDILVKAGQENNFAVGYTMYSFGPFVTSIGGKAGDSSHYWAFYYNGSYSMVGAGDQKVKNGDITTWRYESF